MLLVEAKMNYARTKQLATQIAEHDDRYFFQELIIMVIGLVNWWNDREPRHKLMIGTGIVIIIAGLIDLVLMMFNIPSWLFWANDLLLIFGGIILIQIGIRYAVRSNQ